ncbi:hypothetical protein [Paractinoplanes toevensis]|uniref:Uncharacterized protein n=1 Tax=Paractinoplanes toevensis TaxID=571911 RepID=A0A919TBX0_9ACTN|nr:hypothetical protein [Actinoplanes toevensis]GIM91286.1 hypothetical protein Ato02nite_030790 [Actinoplanes toevensis]
MGLDVELCRIEQAGTSQRHRRTVELAMVGDTRFRFAEAVQRAQHGGSTPMLDRIDLYGTLELSWDEMPQFLGELDHLLAIAEDDREREVLEAVYGLGERCRDDRSLALRLIGD